MAGNERCIINCKRVVDSVNIKVLCPSLAKSIHIISGYILQPPEKKHRLGINPAVKEERLREVYQKIEEKEKLISNTSDFQSMLVLFESFLLQRPALFKFIYTLFSCVMLKANINYL